MSKAREYSSPLMEELIKETTPEELEKINKEMEAMIPKFKVGDKLEALYHHKEEYGLEYATITSITLKERVVGVLKIHSIEKVDDSIVIEQRDFEQLADNLIKCFEQFGSSK